MQLTQFTTMRNKTIDFNTGYEDKLISNISHTRFLGIIFDSIWTWSKHTEFLTKKNEHCLLCN